MEVILYTTHCPKCRILEIKLSQKNIAYTEVADVELMKSKGFLSAPMLEVKTADPTPSSTIMEFGDAVKWINSL